MCFKQITSESTFDKIPRRPFLPRCASYRTVSMAMAKSEKSNWRFFPELFRGTDDIIMISLISDFQSWSIINLRLKKHLKKHICFRESHLFQWPFQWVSPGHKGAMFVDFMGHLQQIMAILNLENPPAWYSGTFLKIGMPKSWFPNENRYIHPFSNVWVRNLCGEALVPAA